MIATGMAAVFACTAAAMVVVVMDESTWRHLRRRARRPTADGRRYRERHILRERISFHGRPLLSASLSSPGPGSKSADGHVSSASSTTEALSATSTEISVESRSPGGRSPSLTPKLLVWLAAVSAVADNGKNIVEIFGALITLLDNLQK